MKRILLNIIMMFVATVAMADKVGTWKLYPSYNDVQEVQETSSDVYVLASGNLFSYHKSDETLTEYMKEGAESATGYSLDVLSSSDITHIAWVQGAKKLVIVYSDGMIDLMDAAANVGHIVSLKNNTENINKTVDSIYVSGKYAFLRTAETEKTKVNIIKIDVSGEYIAKTYKVNEEVSDLPSRSVTPTSKTIPAYTYAKPDGPASNNTWRLYKHDGKIFSTAGNYSSGMTPELMAINGEVDYFSIIKGEWNTLPMPDKYQCANCIAFDPSNSSHFFVGGKSGLLEYNDYETVPTQYLLDGTTLRPLYNTNTSFSVITSMTFDYSGNLWIMNGWSDPAIQCYTSGKTWKSYPHPTISNFEDLSSVDNQGLFYYTAYGLLYWTNNYYQESALYRYDCTQDILRKTSTFTNQDGSPLSPAYIPGIMKDQTGNIWLATSLGPFYIAAANVNDDSFTVVQPKINRNDGTNLADYLLNGVYCRVIKEDQAGRKWIGTGDQGAYLISADNTLQMQHFTKENSPIPSDIIYDILSDDDTGIVYFATANGLCSYQSDVESTYGDLTSDNVYAYPNPVSPDYSGDITIMGLATGCTVKITSATGYVVNSGTCTGASYVWDGCDKSGNRVASGVYMVLVASSDGSDGCVAKIAMIK